MIREIPNRKTRKHKTQIRQSRNKKTWKHKTRIWQNWDRRGRSLRPFGCAKWPRIKPGLYKTMIRRNHDFTKPWFGQNHDWRKLDLAKSRFGKNPILQNLDSDKPSRRTHGNSALPNCSRYTCFAWARRVLLCPCKAELSRYFSGSRNSARLRAYP